MLNSINLQGRLTKDIELKKSKNDKIFCNFCIATDSGLKDKEGKKIAYFINCYAWEKTAEFLEKYFRKGSELIIQGKITTSTYTDNFENIHYRTDVSVSKIDFCGKKPETDGKPYPPEPPEYASKSTSATESQQPSGPVQSPQSVAVNIGNLNEFEALLSEDDLPF